MWARKTLVVLLIVGVVGSGCALAGPAQDVLKDLAQSERNERLITGYTFIGIGVAVGIVSAAVLMDSEIGIYGILAGGLITVPGIVALAVPSNAEIECNKACDSETESALALERLADRGKLNRIMSGVVNIAAGVASLVIPYSYITPYDYLYSAVSSFGAAVVDLLFPSKEERAYARYLTLAGQEG
jgi:predicted lysophospholipase L1 biosynthesis ABC-type transport system permease subunit